MPLAPLLRREGLAKLSGREQYVDDLDIPGALHGITVRSTSARGTIRNIRFDPEIDWSSFVIVDHRDVPGLNTVKLIETDQPALAATEVRHIHEPVVLLAHPSRRALRKAVRAITIEVDPLPSVLDFTVRPTPEQIQHGSDNIYKQITITKGDARSILADAPIIVEGVYRTGAQEHVYLEPQGMIAEEVDGVIIIRGSMQCPYYVHTAVCHALGREADQVRIIQTPTGGAFGGKEEFPSGVAIHAALLALKAGRPVRLVYDRTEDLAATTKRHPSWTRHRTAVASDGQLLAQEITFLLDGGAYMTLSPVVLSRGMIHAAGPYHCEHISIDGRAVLSNTVPFGAFRGFGAPQSLFAVERHMDRIALRLGLDPVTVRQRNLLADGQTTATGQVVADGVDRQGLLNRALSLSDYAAKRETHRQFNIDTPDRRRGIGLTTFFHGAGFTGSGEVYLDSKVAVAGLPDGTIEVRTASTEMGQGTTTIFTQLASDRLGLPPEAVAIAQPDTAVVPNSGPTVASRTAMIVGRLVQEACDDLRRQLSLDATDRGNDVAEAIRAWHRTHPNGLLLGQGHYRPPPGIEWDEGTYRGEAYGAYGWAAYVAEVEVDLRTYGTTVLDFVAVQDVGTVLNTTLARGQVQGGVAQGIGWTLMEECQWEDGAMTNNQLTNYIIPTSSDIPPIRVAFQETPYPHGAEGAKGLGELPMDGPAPAIANAIAAATGAEAAVLPLTPERLMADLDR